MDCIKVQYVEDYKVLQQLIFAIKGGHYTQLKVYENWFRGPSGKTVNTDLFLPWVMNDTREYVFNQWKQKVCV